MHVAGYGDVSVFLFWYKRQDYCLDNPYQQPIFLLLSASYIWIVHSKSYPLGRSFWYLTSSWSPCLIPVVNAKRKTINNSLSSAAFRNRTVSSRFQTSISLRDNLGASASAIRLLEIYFRFTAALNELLRILWTCKIELSDNLLYGAR